MTEWISSLEAIIALRHAGLTKPEETIAQWAEAGLLKSKAVMGRFYYNDEVEEIFPEEPTESTCWPYIPTDFWRCLNHGKKKEAYFEAGIFAATIPIYDGTNHEPRDYEHIKLFNVSFNKDQLTSLINKPLTSTQDNPEKTKPGPKHDIARRDLFCAVMAAELFDIGRKRQDFKGYTRNKLQEIVIAKIKENQADLLLGGLSKSVMDNFIDDTIRRIKEKIATDK